MLQLLAIVALGDARAQAAGAPPEAAAAADQDRARTLFENGKRLYNEGSYEAAIEAWQACYELSGRPELLYNLSNAHERLGDTALALELLNRYRAQAVLTAEQHEQYARKASTLELRMREDEAVARRPRPPLGGIAGAVVGGLAIAGGAVLGSLAQDDRAEVRATCLDLPEGLLCPSAAEAPIRRAEQYGTASLVLLGAGGAAVLTGVTVVARF